MERTGWTHKSDRFSKHRWPKMALLKQQIYRLSMKLTRIKEQFLLFATNKKRLTSVLAQHVYGVSKIIIKAICTSSQYIVLHQQNSKSL